MADQFKPGDVVTLKSGGPPMTVNETRRRQGMVRMVRRQGDAGAIF